MKEYTELLQAVGTWAPEEVGSDKFVYSSIDDEEGWSDGMESGMGRLRFGACGGRQAQGG